MESSKDSRPTLVKEKVVPIEVRLLKQMNEGELPRTEKSVEFLLSCPELDIRMVGSDIEALRKALWSKLEKTHEITWERWYLVQIAPTVSYSGDIETGFSLSQNTIYRGVAHDGSILMREFDRGRTFGPWRYKPWPGIYRTEGGKVIACIPATEQNEAAMDEFRARIRELQRMLGELVKPETIMQTLANLSGIGLPAPQQQSLEADD
ncbi:hypothetical protein [Paucibacter soli]|uniref:hypothetical protein n=1 Tax=Paucibacter soli TaxID=3133433 RepID=UPI0030AE3856